VLPALKHESPTTGSLPYTEADHTSGLGWTIPVFIGFEVLKTVTMKRSVTHCFIPEDRTLQSGTSSHIPMVN
jgi:hypothetical protein